MRFPSKAMAVFLGGALLAGMGPEATLAQDGSSLADAEVALAYGILAFHEGRDAEAVKLLEDAARLHPADGTIRHWLGLAYLRSGRPQEAVAALREALQVPFPPEADRSRVLADLGAAHLAAGEAREAARILADVVVQRPDDAPSLFRYGKALQETGEGGRAQEVLERARRLDPEVEAQAAVIPAPEVGGEVVVVEGPPRWDLRLGFAAAADSNPNLLADDLALPAPDGEILRGEESDEILHLHLRFGYQAPLGEGGPTVGFTLEGRQSLHQDFDFLDLGRARGVFQIAWGDDPLGYLTGPLGYLRVPFGHRRVSFLLQLGTTYDFLDGDSYLRANEGAASVVFREGRRTATQIEVATADLDFFQDRGGSLRRSGSERSAEVSQFVFFGRRNRYLRVGVRRGEREVGEAFDASILEGKVELSLPVARRGTFYLAASLREDDFDNPASNLFSPIVGPSRKDTTARATGALVWSLTPRLYLTLRGTYIDREADLGDLPAFLPSLDYQRTISSAGLSWFF